MMRFSAIGVSLLVLIVGVGLVLNSCSPSMRALNQIPVSKVTVKAVDTEGNPVPGAVVESSGNRKTSTDSTGFAQLRFGATGVYTVTVMADNRAPSTFTVTLPPDNGDTLQARLGDPVTYTSGMGFMSGSFNFSQFYPMMFNWMFSSYGYSMDLKEYEPGEWTEWRVTTSQDDGETTRLRKAFLKENEEGQQWWQIQMRDEEMEDQYIVEVLFSEDRQSIRRIREQVGDEEPRERPVSEGWYSNPQNLTKESIEGAVTEEGLSVETPAGSFTADLLKFGVSPGVDLKLWRAADVPGGVVKYQTENSEEEELIYKNTLLDYGTNAKTILNSY